MFDQLLRRLVRPSVSRQPAGVRLFETLRAIDGKGRLRKKTGAFLSALDDSKDAVYCCFQDHFDSPLPAKALTLKVLNLCLAKYHFLRRSTNIASRPLGLVIDPSNSCGLACPGCVHSIRAEKLGLFHWDRSILSGARLEALLERYGPYAVKADFCNYGEPLLNPETPRFIRLAKCYLLGTVLSSSLSVPRFDANACVESGLDEFTVSIDGATQPVYERFRKRGNLDLVFSNVQRLVEAKKRLGKHTPVVSWHYLVFEHNVHEIPSAAAIARDLGVNRFVLVPPFDVAWDDPGIRPALRRQMIREIGPDSEHAIEGNWNPFSEARAVKAIERAFKAPWRGRIAGSSNTEEQPVRRCYRTCQWLYRSIVMDAGGRILPCCAAPRPDAFLTFAELDGGAKSDPFNTEHYRLARLFFANPDAFVSECKHRNIDTEPHCAKCDWNQSKTSVDSTDVSQYLKTAGGDLVDRESMSLLADW